MRILGTYYYYDKIYWGIVESRSDNEYDYVASDCFSVDLQEEQYFKIIVQFLIGLVSKYKVDFVVREMEFPGKFTDLPSATHNSIRVMSRLNGIKALPEHNGIVKRTLADHGRAKPEDVFEVKLFQVKPDKLAEFETFIVNVAETQKNNMIVLI